MKGNAGNRAGVTSIDHQRLPRGKVPDPDGGVEAAGRQFPTVRTEGQAFDGLGMAIEDRDESSRGHLPDPNRAQPIATPDQGPAIRAENTDSAAFARVQGTDLSAGGQISEHDRSFAIQRREHLRSWTDRDPAPAVRGVAADPEQGSAPAWIPGLDIARSLCRDEDSPVGAEGQ